MEWSEKAQELANELSSTHFVDANFGYMETFLQAVESASGRSDKIKREKGRQNKDKVQAYSYWLPTVAKFADIWKAAEGKGTRSAEAKRAGVLRADLEKLLASCGVTPAKARRYIDNARGVFVNPECAGLAKAAKDGPNSITGWFVDQEIETETAIRELWARPTDKIKGLAGRVSKLTTAERKRLSQLVAKLDREAEQAEAKANREAKKSRVEQAA